MNIELALTVLRREQLLACFAQHIGMIAWVVYACPWNSFRCSSYSRRSASVASRTANLPQSGHCSGCRVRLNRKWHLSQAKIILITEKQVYHILSDLQGGLQ